MAATARLLQPTALSNSRATALASWRRCTLHPDTRTLGGWQQHRRSSSGGSSGGGGSDGQPFARSGLCTPPAASVKDELLKGVDEDNRDAVARIIEQAQRAADSWSVGYSDFHTPPVIADAMLVVKRMADVSGVVWGGYPQAERCRLAVGREETLQALPADLSLLCGVAAVQCRGNFLFDPATHRDFLGACLATGIERGKVGDILINGEQGAQILVSPTLVEHLQVALTQVRTVPVQTLEISLSELQVRPPRVEEVSSMEASLRLDAVASAGMRMSRSKMMDLIKSGDVRVNWKSGPKPSSDVAAGDMISVAGKGRLEVQAVTRTQKGKWRVQMVRYL